MKTSLAILSCLFIMLCMTATADATTIDAWTAIGIIDPQTGSVDAGVGPVIEHGTSGTVVNNISYGDIYLGSGAIASSSGDVDGNTAVEAAFRGYDAQVQADVYWSESYTITTAGVYTWDFTVTDGELAINEYCGEVVFEMGIFLGTDHIWNTGAALSGSRGASSYTTWGTDLGETYHNYGLAPNYLWDGWGYTYADYTGSLNLGTHAAGDTIELNYFISVRANGPGGSGLMTGMSGGFASLGDPGQLGNSSITGGITFQGGEPAPVPEPATCLLLGSGLVGMGFTFKKKRRELKE